MRTSDGGPSAPQGMTGTGRGVGWVEVGTAVATAVILYIASAPLLLAFDDERTAWPGLIAFAVSGLVPLCAFGAAVLVRLRALTPFGVRRTERKWFPIAVVTGLALLGLSWPVAAIVDPLVSNAGEVQQSYWDTTSAGPAAILGAVVLGGLLTPLGEEALFRGVLASFLFRWGAVVGVGVSAVAFALSHGINDVTPMALLVGIATGVLYRYSGSIWPGVVVHMVYNTAGILVHAIGWT